MRRPPTAFLLLVGARAASLLGCSDRTAGSSDAGVDAAPASDGGRLDANAADAGGPATLDRARTVADDLLHFALSLPPATRGNAVSRDARGGALLQRRMLLLVVSVAILLGALVITGVGIASRRVAAHREHDDQPGVQSAVTFELPRDEGSLPALLDRLHARLESAGADAGSFAAKGVGFELDGMLGADTFRVTLAPIHEPTDEVLPSSFEGYLLILHARILGRYRYVAPPATQTTTTLLGAIDSALRTAPEVSEVVWRSRQEQPSPLG